MEVPQELWVAFVALLGPTVLYGMNNVPAFQDSLVILGMGVVVLDLVFFLVYLALLRRPPKDPLFYILVEFSFLSAFRLTNALEQDGHISGFMYSYIKLGEPYLSNAYSILMCYWDGTVQLLVTFLLARRMRQGKPYRSLGLFWAGSCLTNMTVFLLGIVTGKLSSTVRPALWLNIPFLLASVWSTVSLLSQHRHVPVMPAGTSKSVFLRPLDLLLMFSLLLAVTFTTFRGLVVLECPLDQCFTYVYQYEPYLKDPVGFPRVTMLIFLFYGLPLMLASLYGLSVPGCTWMLDWTMVLAGAMTQAQWCHLGGSLHPRTPYTYRIPQDTWWPVLICNILYTCVPLLLAARCHISPALFMKQMPPGQADADKKSK